MQTRISQQHFRRAFPVLCLILAPMLLMAAVLIAGQISTEASSHREAPLISDDPFVDNTDTYVFVSPTNPDNVVLVASWIPFEGPEGGPNYYEWDDNAFYEIHVDNDGDAVADYTYMLTSTTTVQNPFTFLYNVGPIGADGANWNRQQRYTLQEISAGGTETLVDNMLAPPVNIGSKSTADYEALADNFIYPVNNNGDEISIYAGQTDDPFWVDLQVFDLLTLRGQGAPIGYSEGNNSPIDSLAGFNVHTLVVEVPISRLTQGDEPVLGVWATASRSSMRVLNGLAGLSPLSTNATFTVALTGEAEVPGPGDEDGIGEAVLTIDLQSYEVCYTLTTENIDEPTAGHIHLGAADASGGVAIALFGDGADAAGGCVNSDAETVDSIMDSPRDFYVNIHNGEFPAGAIRGQLVETILTSTLTGAAAEVPGPGDSDGTGEALLTFDLQSNEVCYTLSIENIDDPTAGHIHEGTADVAGDVVIALFSDSANAAEGCVAADADIISTILENPTGFYVNIHNPAFPSGAIRGQLEEIDVPVTTITPGLETHSGDSIQVSRLGMPLVNEAVLPYALKDAFNGLMPSQDLSVYVDPTLGPILQNSVEDPELGRLLCGLYGVPLPGDTDGDCSTEVEIGTPRSGRGDIFDIFLTGMVLASEFTIQTAGGPVTLPAGFNVNQPAGVQPAEMIRINTDIKGDTCSPTPSRLGVLGGDACGFPNGRRLIDDVVEIELLAVAGAAYAVLDGRDADFSFNADFIAVLDDGIDVNDMPFRTDFPYLAPAQSGQEHLHANAVVETATITPTMVVTATATVTATVVPTDTPTLMPTATVTATLVPTDTPTLMPTDTPMPVPTDTPMPVPTDTPMPVPTDTPMPVPTDTPMPVPTDTPMPVPTDTPMPAPTDTPMPASTDTPMPVPTDTPMPASTDTPMPAPTDTPMPASTDTPMPAPTDTPMPVPTDTPMPAPTDTPVPTDTPTDVPTDTPVPTDTLTPVPTDTPTPVPTNTLVPGNLSGTVTLETLGSQGMVQWNVALMNTGELPVDDIVLVIELPSNTELTSVSIALGWTAQETVARSSPARAEATVARLEVGTISGGSSKSIPLSISVTDSFEGTDIQEPAFLVESSVSADGINISPGTTGNNIVIMSPTGSENTSEPGSINYQIYLPMITR